MFHVHNKIAQHLLLCSVDLYHNIKLFNDVLDLSLKDPLWINVKERDVKLFNWLGVNFSFGFEDLASGICPEIESFKCRRLLVCLNRSC
jgi:hypothetical protein